MRLEMEIWKWELTEMVEGSAKRLTQRSNLIWSTSRLTTQPPNHTHTHTQLAISVVGAVSVSVSARLLLSFRSQLTLLLLLLTQLFAYCC